MFFFFFFLEKDINQTEVKKFLQFKKLRIQLYEEITGTFYEKEFPKTNQKEFRIEKITKRKGNKLYVEWKAYDNSFNS